MKTVTGPLVKMRVEYDTPIRYFLRIGSSEVLLNDYLGKEFDMTYLNQINCADCGKVTKKSFGGGFCFKCFNDSPMAAPCIIKPELCRAHLGEGRDVEWEEKHHNRPHYVYLAAVDKVKVGITREDQIPTRWIDQGAKQAIILAETNNRYEAGVLEVALKDEFSDKTNWRNMLKDVTDESIDLEETKWEIEELLPSDLSQFISDHDEVWELDYPVNSYPDKVTSLNFDKDPVIRKILKGIRGQYLIFEDDTVINLRKFTGYNVLFQM